MAEENILKKNKNIYEAIDKDINESFNQRIQTKLTLRKQKFNQIITRKRLSDLISIINNNENNSSKWKLLYNINKEKLEMKNNYKFDFKNDEDEEILSLSLKYLNSDKINDIKYSIILLELFINKHKGHDLTNYINLMFIYDLIHLIEKFITNKEIIFNILYIILRYSNTADPNLSIILLSPNSYKIWEMCFNLQDYEIFYEIVSIFNNIILENHIAGCNLLRSSFLKNSICNFYMADVITSQMNNSDKKNIIYNIINNGIILFCNLFIVNIDNLDRFTKEEIFLSKQQIIKVIFTYSSSNLFHIYHPCIYSIFLATQSERRLIDEFDKNNFIQNILKEKKIFDNDEIKYFVNTIIGNYIAFKNKIKFSLLIDILSFEKEYLNNCNFANHRKGIFWVLSNMIICDKNIVSEIIKDEKFLENLIFYYKNSYSIYELKEISYFFGHLIINADKEQFIKIEKHKLMEIVIYHAKQTLQNDVEGLLLIFELLEFYFGFGKLMSKYYEGKNKVIEKFDKLGGKELLDKYINFDNKKLTEQIEYILREFYDN